MSSAGELLDYARTLIERGWCRGADARDADGGAVKAWASSAAAWSLLGALVATIERRADRGGPFAVTDLAHACVYLAQLVEVDSLEVWNDHPSRTQFEVLDVLEHAAGLARAEPRTASLS